MTSAPTVRLATRDELPVVGRILARAFADDPIQCWLVPVPAAADDQLQREDRAAIWFETEARVQFDGAGEVWVDDDLRGAAVWCSPGRWRQGFRESMPMLLPSLRYLRGGTLRGLATITRMERAHPADPPHWYLSILGTDPDHQGSGVGAALVRAVTDRCDAEGLPSYLESSKESNVGWYRRFGYEPGEVLSIRDAPPMTTMWRDPEVRP